MLLNVAVAYSNSLLFLVFIQKYFVIKKYQISIEYRYLVEGRHPEKLGEGKRHSLWRYHPPNQSYGYAGVPAWRPWTLVEIVFYSSVSSHYQLVQRNWRVAHVHDVPTRILKESCPCFMFGIIWFAMHWSLVARHDPAPAQTSLRNLL